MLWTDIFDFFCKYHVSRHIYKMFHIFSHYILGYDVSRETLSSIVFYVFYEMFHVKHFIN